MTNLSLMAEEVLKDIRNRDASYGYQKQLILEALKAVREECAKVAERNCIDNCFVEEHTIRAIRKMGE